MIQPAGRGEGGRDLGHRQRDDECQQATQRPAQPDRRAADAREALLKRRDAAGQDADNRERDGEVREAAHAPQQLLAVAQAVQRLDVLLDQDVRGFLSLVGRHGIFAR